MHILILGGTTQATQLVGMLSDDRRFQTTFSLAGRTTKCVAQRVRCRIGGFGGAAPLADWLASERIDAVVDATHPFAARISANAVAAAKLAQLPLLSLSRPPWDRLPEDNWTCVQNIEAAVQAPGPQPKRVFLTIGRQEVGAFREAPHHTYVIRSIDPPDDSVLPPDTHVILQRGPFDEAAEIALMQSHHIEIVVAKNSGGAATYAKVAAARKLGLPLIMIDRPDKPVGVVANDVGDAHAWLVSQLRAHPATSSDRGV